MSDEERRTQESTEENRSEEPAGEQEDGLVSKAVNKAQERGMVDESMIEKAREKGLIDKANEAVDKLKNRFGGR